MSTPCNNGPIKFVTCCQIMDCIHIFSSDQSITVETLECGVNLTQTGVNLDKILKIKDGECISFEKEYISGVLTYTPVLDFDCIFNKIKDDLCEYCTPVTCPGPLNLIVTVL